MTFKFAATTTSSDWLRYAALIATTILVWCGAAKQLRAAPPASQAEQPTSAQIARWVQQLDDDSFEARDDATRLLIAAGAPAVAPISQVLANANLEVTMRAVHVLRQLALSGDMEAQERGLSALVEAASSENRSAARLAREAIDKLDELRQQQAIVQLSDLGARVEGYGAVGFTPRRSLEVEIGPDWKGEVKDLRRLSWLRDLGKVSFVGPRVTDQWVASIQDIAQLRAIAIKNANVTDESLRMISQLRSVVFVDLMYCPVTDQGFEHFWQMKSVRQIRCFGTKITREAADRFQAELAEVNVQHKQGAFLGVSCQQPPWPCQVVRVTPDSAADKAGVKAEDIIVEFDGKPVGSFDDLQKLIAVKKVGDSVQIRVARGAERSMARTFQQQPFEDLGIAMESTTLGLRLTRVETDKGAAKAGFRPGDVIVALDDVRTTTKQQFRKIYDQPPALPARRIEILRDVKFLSKKVTFGEWDERLLP
jgi:hypothetical protein